jgi:sugar phosphate isomerase/epimerase
MSHDRSTLMHRRGFLAALGGGAALAAGGGLASRAQTRPSLARFAPQLGLQMYTVRDRYPTDYPGTLRAIAAIGYKAVQPTGSYGGVKLDEVGKLFADNGLVAATTHVSPPDGDQFEPTLAAYAKIGHRYTTVRQPAPRTLEACKQAAAKLNAAGTVTRKHGLKVMYHNHAEEFQKLPGGETRVYDVLIAETDPALVAMELDIGWAVAGGADPLALFKQAPVRFEVWHVKDIADLKSLAPIQPVNRATATKIVAMGQGEIDYRPIFAAAEQAGMKHYYVEQDSAPASGDSLAQAAISYRHMTGLLV